MKLKLYTISIKAEYRKVDIKLYAKNGIAKVQHTISPSKVQPYWPLDQTPKFVKIKNKIAPDKTPPILKIIFLLK